MLVPWNAGYTLAWFLLLCSDLVVCFDLAFSRARLVKPRLTSSSLGSWAWPWTPDPPTSASQMLQWPNCVTIPGSWFFLFELKCFLVFSLLSGICTDPPPINSYIHRLTKILCNFPMCHNTCDFYMWRTMRKREKRVPRWTLPTKKGWDTQGSQGWEEYSFIILVHNMYCFSSLQISTSDLMCVFMCVHACTG